MNKENYKSYTFDNIVLFARTGLNPRDNFKLGQGNNKYITIKNIQNNELIIDKNTDVVDDEAIKLIHKRSQIKKGDILFASIGRIGDMYIIQEEPKGWDINESVFAFTLNTKIVEQKYFYYIFKNQTTIDYLKNNSSGSTFKSIKMNQLKRMSFLLPSLEKQTKISQRLDKCNRIINHYKSIIEKYDMLIKSRFIEMFGDPVQNPMGWKQRQLQDVCNAIVDCPHSTPNYTKENTGFMCIRTNIIRPTELNWDDIEYISENEFYKRVSRRQPRIGDIVYLREGGILGIAAIINRNVNVALGQRTMLLSPNYEICNSIYVCETMNMKSFFNKALEKMGGSASPHINVADIKAFPISIPPIELQNDFAAFVHQIDKSKFEIWLTLKNCGIIGNRVF